MRKVLSVSCLLAAACGSPNPGPLQEKSSEIVGGQVEAGYAAVGALVANGDQFCTGTLVTDRAIVTAAHCLEGGTEASAVTFFIGADTRSPSAGTALPVASLHSHPQYDGEQLVNDIAVVLLAQPASVAPIARVPSMDASWVGRDALFVGYGVTSANANTSGEKRSVTIPITAVDAGTFRYEHRARNTCFGDSGGPALADTNGTTHLLGVTSYGDNDCAEYGVNTRVDAHAAWIDGIISGAPTTPTPPPTTEPPATEPPPATGGDDLWEEQGWYSDGTCDECPRPDPDCADDTEDECQAQGWYGDGFCDDSCAKPDPDCDEQGSNDACEAQGLYGDGACDEGCPEPDPDCGEWSSGGEGEDICEVQGWYNDGWCDDVCADPDPDCD